MRKQIVTSFTVLVARVLSVSITDLLYDSLFYNQISTTDDVLLVQTVRMLKLSLNMKKKFAEILFIIR